MRVVLGFHLNKPIDLRHTFIAGTALDYIERQAGAAAQHGLLVREQVSSTRVLSPARRLRQKVLAMLPDIEGPLRLDFLADSPLGWERKSAVNGFRYRNMPLLVGQIANVVISQRLRGLEPTVADEGDED